MSRRNKTIISLYVTTAFCLVVLRGNGAAAEPAQPAEMSQTVDPVQTSAQAVESTQATESSAAVGDAKQPTQDRGLFPLLFWRKTSQSRLFVSPLFGWKLSAERSLVIAGPYGYRRVGNDDRTNALFPLFLFRRSPDHDASVVFPFFWRFREGEEVNTTIFPLFWYLKAPQETAGWVAPFFGWKKSPDGHRAVVGPFWEESFTDRKTFGFFPLFAWWRTLEDKRHTTVFISPAVVYAGVESGRKTLVAGPYYDTHTDKTAARGLIPLFFQWRDDKKTRALAPFFYRGYDLDRDRLTTVVGPAYWGHTAGIHRFGLVPLWFSDWGEKRKTTFFFPLFYWQLRENRTVGASPLFGWSRYPGGVQADALLFYGRNDENYSAGAVWPLVYFSRAKKSEAGVSMVAPLFFDRKNDLGDRLTIVTPLYWRYRSIENESHIVPPLVFDVHNFGESRTTAGLPFFIRKRSTVHDSTWWTLPPLLSWWRHRPDAWNGRQVTDAVVFPLFWRYGGEESKTVFAPLYWDFKKKESRTSVWVPVGAYWRRPEAKHVLVLNSYFRSGLGPNQGTWYYDFFPLIGFGKPDPDGVKWKFLEGFVGYTRIGKEKTLELLWFLDIRLDSQKSAGVDWWDDSSSPSTRTEF